MFEEKCSLLNNFIKLRIINVIVLFLEIFIAFNHTGNHTDQKNRFTINSGEFLVTLKLTFTNYFFVKPVLNFSSHLYEICIPDIAFINIARFFQSRYFYLCKRNTCEAVRPKARSGI